MNYRKGKRILGKLFNEKSVFKFFLAIRIFPLYFFQEVVNPIEMMNK